MNQAQDTKLERQWLRHEKKWCLTSAAGGWGGLAGFHMRPEEVGKAEESKWNPKTHREDSEPED